jgi:hypothetical protein
MKEVWVNGWGLLVIAIIVFALVGPLLWQGFHEARRARRLEEQIRRDLLTAHTPNPTRPEWILR